MRAGAIIITVLMVGVAFGVYFGMDYVPADALPDFIKRADKQQAAPQATAPKSEPAPAPASPPPAAAEMPQPEAAEAEEPAEPTPAETAEEPAPVPADEPAIAEAEGTPEPAPATEPKESVAVAKAPAPRPSEPARAPVKPKPPEADSIQPWWPNPESIPENQLKLLYAGQVQGQPAIALLFSSPLNLDTLKKNAEVRTAEGVRIRGDWELGSNPRLAVFRNVGPGRYTVILEPVVADAQGFMLGTALQGPVYIQDK